MIYCWCLCTNTHVWWNYLVLRYTCSKALFGFKIPKLSLTLNIFGFKIYILPDALNEVYRIPQNNT